MPLRAGRSARGRDANEGRYRRSAHHVAVFICFQYTQMDSTSAQTTFASLASAMEKIHNHNASTLSFEKLYRNAYNLVLDKHVGLLYQGVQDHLDVHTQRRAD